MSLVLIMCKLRLNVGVSAEKWIACGETLCVGLITFTLLMGFPFCVFQTLELKQKIVWWIAQELPRK